MKTYFKIFLPIVIFLNMVVSVMAETPEEKGLRIATEADLDGKGFKDIIQDMEMILRNAQGDESIRMFNSKTLEVDGDGDKSIFIFEHPRDVEGTAVLTFTHKVGPDCLLYTSDAADE